MNTELFNKHYHEQLDLLPALNRQAIESVDWQDLLIDIGKSHGIDSDDIDDLQLETMLVLVGLENPSNYENQLISQLALSPAEADKLINDITAQIFTPIHDYIVNSTKSTGIPTGIPTSSTQTTGSLSSLPVGTTPSFSSNQNKATSSDIKQQIHAGFHDIEFISEQSEPNHETIIDKKLNDIFEDEVEVIHHL